MRWDPEFADDLLRDELLNREVFETFPQRPGLSTAGAGRPSARNAGWEFILAGWTPHDSGSNFQGGTRRGGRSDGRITN